LLSVFVNILKPNYVVYSVRKNVKLPQLPHEYMLTSTSTTGFFSENCDIPIIILLGNCCLKHKKKIEKNARTISFGGVRTGKQDRFEPEMLGWRVFFV